MATVNRFCGQVAQACLISTLQLGYDPVNAAEKSTSTVGARAGALGLATVDRLWVSRPSLSKHLAVGVRYIRVLVRVDQSEEQEQTGCLRYSRVGAVSKVQQRISA